MRISESAYRTILLTARFVSDIAAREVECMGYLLAEKGSSTITGFFFPQHEGLDAKSGTSDFPYTGMYEKGFNIVGMWHSHGSFPLFHSGIDYSHIANKLRAIARENALLNSWQAYSIENEIHLFSAETMQGFKILLKSNAPDAKAKPREILNVKELFPKEFYSIVVNKDSYRKGKQCHAMRFSLLGDELLKAEEQVEIAQQLQKETLEEIAEKFSCEGIALKDMKAYKSLKARKAKQEGSAVNIVCEKGSFALECKTKDEAMKLSEAIVEIKELEEKEKEQLKQNIPKRLSADKKLEYLLGNKTEAIVPVKPYISDDEHLNRAMEIHAMCVRKFLALIPYYTKAELDSEKAVIDIFAALSGVFDSSQTKEGNMAQRADMIKKICARMRYEILDSFAKNSIDEAERIIKGGNYSKTDKRAMLAKLRQIRKQKTQNKQKRDAVKNA